MLSMSTSCPQAASLLLTRWCARLRATFLLGQEISTVEKVRGLSMISPICVGLCI